MPLSYVGQVYAMWWVLLKGSLPLLVGKTLLLWNISFGRVERLSFEPGCAQEAENRLCP